MPSDLYQSGIPNERPVQSFDLLGRRWAGGGGMGEGGFSRDPLSVFSAGGSCEHFRHGEKYPLFDVVQPAFPLLTTALPTSKAP